MFWYGIVLGVLLHVCGFSTTGLSDAPLAVQKQWEATMKNLEEEITEEYYTGRAQWKQEFECASCRAVMADLGSVVEKLSSWTTSVPTEDAYLERFNAYCAQADRKYSLRAIEDYDRKYLWYEQSPISIQSAIHLVDKEKEPTLTMPFIRRAVENMCNNILNNYFSVLTNISSTNDDSAKNRSDVYIPTARFLSYLICVKKLNVCNEEKLTTQLYSSPSKREIQRFREKGQIALQQFWNVLADKTNPERRRIRCMACDVTLAHIQDEIGWRNPNVQKRTIHPTIPQLVKTCGSKKTWEPWGLWYNFWSERVVTPYFIKEKNLSQSAVKLQAEVVPILLFDVCKEVAETSRTDLDGYEEPVPNCHNMPWCQFTEWESDSRSENTNTVIEIERDKAKTKWIRIGKQSIEPEETDAEIEEDEKREAELAAQKKAERAKKRAKASVIHKEL